MANVIIEASRTLGVLRGKKTLLTMLSKKTFMKKVVLMLQLKNFFCLASFTVFWLVAVKRLMEEET